MSDSQTPLAARAVRRALSAREAAATEEVQRLIDAATKVMRDTAAPPRVADIVAAAGLSNQAFYRHFAGRDELVAAVVESGAFRLVGYLAHRMERAGEDPVQRIRAWIEGVMSQAANPDVAASTRAVLWNSRQLPRRAGERGTMPAITELLDAPLRDLGVADPTRDAAAITDVVFGRLDHYLWVEAPTDDDIEHLVSFCLRAVVAERTADGT